MASMRWMFLACIALSLFWPTVVSVDYINPDWIQPNAWDKARKMRQLAGQGPDNVNGKDSSVCILNETDHSSEDKLNYNLLLSSYKRLLKYLFKKDKMKSHPTDDYYIRHVQLKISETDLEQLNQLIDTLEQKDVNLLQLNNIISQILYVSQNMHVERLFTWIDKMVFLAQEMYFNPQVKFTLMFTLVIFIIWLVSKYYNIRILVLTFMVGILISFYMLYVKCNMHKQHERLNRELKLLNCHHSKTAEGFWSHITSFFGSRPVSECGSEPMDPSDICTPIEVWMELSNIVIFSQFTHLAERFTDITTTILSKCGFPYNIIALFIVIFVLKNYLISLISTFLGAGVESFINHKRNWQRNNQIDSSGDRLSGANLEKLMKMIESRSVAINEIMSGVQEINDNNVPRKSSFMPLKGKDEGTSSQSKDSTIETDSTKFVYDHARILKEFLESVPIDSTDTSTSTNNDSGEMPDLVSANDDN